MPEMDFSEAPLLIGFFPYLFWPNDKNKRDAYIAMLMNQSVDWIEQAAEEALGPFRFVMKDSESFVTKKSELWEELWIDKKQIRKASVSHSIDSLQKEAEKLAPKLFMAGQIVLCLETMARFHANDKRLRGGPSLTKAMWIVGKGHSKSDTAIESCWRKFRGVSHFLAGAITISGDGSIDRFVEAILNAHKFPDLFLNAFFYQRFLRSYVPRGHQVPLLCENDMWLIPSDMQVPEIEVRTTPLPDELLEYLSSRKSNSQ